MRSYNALIESLCEGNTPREKYEWLDKLIHENNRAKGRIDFCRKQFEILLKDESTHPVMMGFIRAIINTLDTPI